MHQHIKNSFSNFQTKMVTWTVLLRGMIQLCFFGLHLLLDRQLYLVWINCRQNRGQNLCMRMDRSVTSARACAIAAIQLTGPIAAAANDSKAINFVAIDHNSRTAEPNVAGTTAFFGPDAAAGNRHQRTPGDGLATK